MLTHPRKPGNLPHPPTMLLSGIVRLDQPHHVAVVLADVQVRVRHDFGEFGHVAGEGAEGGEGGGGGDGGDAEEAGEVPD